ncbi:MAG: Uma2 family endonuclease [Candidatus Kapabacteria bacterium]|jgi:Uma2 family endonuclease|nr:Uma2 family endonuclease [Candidatus Kapabacteria bacterium]
MAAFDKYEAETAFADDDVAVESLAEPSIHQHPKTVAEYLAMPEGPPFFQFINGKGVEMPAPSIFHQDIVLNIGSAIKTYLRTNPLGKVIIAPVDVHFSDTDYYEPDVIVIRNEHLHFLTQNRVIGAPDLVVEVLSPSTGYYDLSGKKAVYEQEGVREYWLVYPNERRVEVLQNTADGFVVLNQARRSGVVRSAVLEGFSLDIATIFE